jgi:hypothetical protein
MLRYPLPLWERVGRATRRVRGSFLSYASKKAPLTRLAAPRLTTLSLKGRGLHLRKWIELPRANQPSGARLPGAADAVFERGELLDADRPARMHAAGRDADLGAEAELAAIGELG